MAALKSAQIGAEIGSALGPEGEVIGAGVGGLAGLAASIGRALRHEPSTAEEKQSLLDRSQDLFTTRPGTAEIRRRPMPSSVGAPPPRELPPPPAPRARPRVDPSGPPAVIRTIDRYGRRPIIAAIAGAAVAPVAAQGLGGSEHINISNPPPEVEHLPKPNRRPPQPNAPTSTPTQVQKPLPGNQPDIPVTIQEPMRIHDLNRHRTPTVNREYVGNFHFPIGAYNYVDYSKFARNNTLDSLEN